MIVSERTDFRLEARTALVVLLGFVVWGAFLAYQGTWLAPRAHYTELEKIGEDFDGEGPALVTEVSGYGPRHFLADLDPEGASDRRRRAVLLRNGEPTPDAVPVDLDEIRPDQLDPYNLLILRRGPATSRPPSEFRLAYSSDHYEVWRRTEKPGNAGKKPAPGNIARRRIGPELLSGRRHGEQGRSQREPRRRPGRHPDRGRVRRRGTS